MASEPPNKHGPHTALQDTLLEVGEVFVMCVPYDISEQDPATWTTSSGGSPPTHPCVLIRRSRLGSTPELEFFVLWSFEGRAPCEVTKRPLTANEYLPLPHPSGEPTITPAAFGKPLSAPGSRMQSQTWLLIHSATIPITSHTKVIRTYMIYVSRELNSRLDFCQSRSRDLIPEYISLKRK